MDTFAQKKSAIGRIKPSRLFAFNEKLKKEALQEKSYWDMSKDSHPLNRWQFLRWEKQVRTESIFLDRANRLPVDQKMRFKKSLMASANMRFIIPISVVLYFGFCFVRHKVFGTTPYDANMSLVRIVKILPRAPTS